MTQLSQKAQLKVERRAQKLDTIYKKLIPSKPGWLGPSNRFVDNSESNFVNIHLGAGSWVHVPAWTGGWTTLFDNYRVERFIVEVNNENDKQLHKWSRPNAKKTIALNKRLATQRAHLDQKT